MYNEFWPGGPKFLADRAFNIGTDAVMLYAFCRKMRAKRVCDLGCGSGVIGQLLAFSNENICVTGVEIQKASADAALENAKLNGLDTRFDVVCGDLREYKKLPIASGSFDLVVMNPPYFPQNSGKTVSDDATAIARDERFCTLDDACTAAAYFTKWGGRFCMVHRPERLSEVMTTMSNKGLEPKTLRFVQHRDTSAPNLILVEALRGGKPGLNILPPLVLTNPDGSDTDEVKEIYHR